MIKSRPNKPKDSTDVDMNTGRVYTFVSVCVYISTKFKIEFGTAAHIVIYRERAITIKTHALFHFRSLDGSFVALMK